MYGEVTVTTCGSRATCPSMVWIEACTAGTVTVPDFVWKTICSVSPAWLGAACCRRLAAAALCVPEKLMLAA